MSNTFEKPAFFVTVGNAFFNIVEDQTSDTITYKPNVIEMPIIKTLGLTRAQSETKIFASGTMYDTLSMVSSAEISLGAVALPESLINELEGATVENGFVTNRSLDVNKAFAFGYWAQMYNGELLYFWHPTCKLSVDTENFDSKTEDIPEPNKNYKITILPFNGIWRIKYSTELAKASGKIPLTKEEFFATPIYNEETMPEQDELVL